MSSRPESRRGLANFLPRSVVARTSLGILVLAVTMGALFSALASWRLRAAEEDRLMARVHELAATVESTVSVASFLGDEKLAREIATGLLKNQVLSGVRILAGDKVLQAIGGPAPEDRGAVRDAVTRPIYSPFDEKMKVGEITLYVSHAEIEARAIAYSRYTTWMLALQVVIVAAGVAFLVYLLVTRPIKGISDELHRLEIRSGMRLTVPSYRRADEIGQLVVDVNALITRLSDALSTERELRLAQEISERRMRLVFEKAETGILVLDEDGRVQSGNPSFARILGLESSPEGVSLAALLAPHGPLVAGLIAESFALNVPRDADLEIEVRGRGKVWVELSVNPLGPRLLQGLLNDITERKRAESHAQELAVRDPLTGLLNRRGLDSALHALLGAAFSEARPLAVLLIDLDFFKQVNDTFGHAAGDAVLREVAKVLTRRLRRSDVLARAGGDEFVCILPGIDGEQKAREIALDIVEELHRPIDLGEGRLAHIGASIGVALTGVDRESADRLLHRADAAMYAAKQAGRGQVRTGVEGDLEADPDSTVAA